VGTLVDRRGRLARLIPPWFRPWHAVRVECDVCWTEGFGRTVRGARGHLAEQHDPTSCRKLAAERAAAMAASEAQWRAYWREWEEWATKAPRAAPNRRA
jgi:hypothetical protein